MNHGNFVISLDFELMWGVRDLVTIEQYGKNIAGVHSVIPKLLDAFGTYNVEATFATVGFLFFETKAGLLPEVPALLPTYSDTNLSPYNGHFNEIKDNHTDDPYHYAPLLIRAIQKHPRHEISTHTFSHYYCLEPGQTKEQFREDLIAAKKIAAAFNIPITSIIFPRNQYNVEYTDVCTSLGITSYRGNERHWVYDSTKEVSNVFLKFLISLGGSKKAKLKLMLRRLFRKMDAYINISGNNCYSLSDLKNSFPVDIPSSRLLRPYSPALALFEPLRLRRIINGMTYAAKNNLTFHLWWHPHNFGIHQDKNFAFLEKILKHYQYLNKTYNFQSITMTNLANSILTEHKNG